MAKQKYYVVWIGRTPGIYASWSECQAQVNAFLEAKYKSYESLSEAEAAFQEGWKKHVAAQGKKPNKPSSSDSPVLSVEIQAEIDWDSISVDVGTKGNPGEVEYKGVDTRTGAVVFSHRPIDKGTNNLGEFLAIVHALAFLKKSGSSKTVYSDSVNAINWVKKRQVSSTLTRDESTRDIWGLVDRAVHWLESNSYKNKVLKWQTGRWGEIKADYGRK